MNFTSHFVGITLRNKYFSNIFSEISEILWKNLNKILELQNSLTLHITLYYLPANLKDSDLEKIKNIISDIDLQKIHLQTWKLDYFREKIAYISYKNCNYLEKINKIFKNNFSNYNSILDNTYKFIPL